MRVLYASNTLVSSLEPLADLIEIESLNVSSTRVTDISPLGRMSKLRYLSIGINATERPPSSPPTVSDISPLAHLNCLELLYMMCTTPADISPLFALTGLRKLFLYGVNLSKADLERLREALPTTDFFGP